MSNINMETAIANMYALKARGITYSMNYSRTGADGTGDCSGTDIKINKLFVEALQNGEVLALGDAIVDPNLSGCSSILQAQEVRVNIVFAPKAYMERKEELIEEKTAEIEKQKKEQQELAIQKDNVVKSARLAEAVINELVDEVAEKHELQELVKQIKESMRYF